MARILLVDDDGDGLALRKLVLEHHGHEVSTAATPAEAMKWAETSPVDCVISDLRLPELRDGVALLRDLRRVAPRTRIVILSGADVALAEQDRVLADMVLAKPIRCEQLLQAETDRST